MDKYPYEEASHHNFFAINVHISILKLPFNSCSTLHNLCANPVCMLSILYWSFNSWWTIHHNFCANPVHCHMISILKSPFNSCKTIYTNFCAHLGGMLKLTDGCWGRSRCSHVEWPGSCVTYWGLKHPRQNPIIKVVTSLLLKGIIINALKFNTQLYSCMRMK